MADMDITDKKDDWKGAVIWKMPEWIEPVAIVSILLFAMFITRRKSYSIMDRARSPNYRPLIATEDSPRVSDDSDLPQVTNTRYPPKRRRILGIWTVQTPNSTRFAGHIHSRILQKFPFLVEMFYWAITYFFYRMTAYLSALWYGGKDGLWEVAQDHGIALLEMEAWALGSGATNGTQRWLEWRVQQWFIIGAEAGDWRRVFLTVLNRVYALIHIPGTVGFIAYYYTVAPNHPRFCTVRRTMSLLNLFAFFIFTVYPCMPPRLLPKEFGFIDTVNAEDAASVWMSGNYVNKLAAMPSMHFGYSFCIGCVFVYESGFLRQWCRLTRKRVEFDSAAELVSPSYPPSRSERDGQRSASARGMYLFTGILYPSIILLTIVATANHYFLDAVAAIFVVLVAFICNKMLLNFLVLEDWLLWAWRLEKPEPTTGLREKIK
ncbi:uncharacterized protein BCR38DRAFT_406406 [Pseudomassariella vexata]|uniref:Inositolphosphotransferase Aur1/Ipt1 domain-containing protein n=1 Tax=Pseudomassariella vexata TaxID=1141098 RepID=A0A1Y2EB03_9PEZI|nr:uncharacterized protein BCR38DRAFT_406406 [Pseudomassariella vexata]ORY68484.1 hypothetical protein BCR38DRAFT_406406 [Pseudomassariella vexata]